MEDLVGGIVSINHGQGRKKRCPNNKEASKWVPQEAYVLCWYRPRAWVGRTRVGHVYITRKIKGKEKNVRAEICDNCRRPRKMFRSKMWVVRGLQKIGAVWKELRDIYIRNHLKKHFLGE